MIKFYYQNQCSIGETFCMLHGIYVLRRNCPAEVYLDYSTSTGSINIQSTIVRHRNAKKYRGSQFLVVSKNLAFLRLQRQIWNYLKSQIRVNKLSTSDALKVNIIRFPDLSATNKVARDNLTILYFIHNFHKIILSNTK